MNVHRQPPEPATPGVCAVCGEAEADLAVSPLCRDCAIAARIEAEKRSEEAA